MRHRPDQTVRPVVVAQGCLLARRELEAAVGAEMDNGIGMEAEPCPKICGDVGVRRCTLRAVHDFEGVAAKSGHGLRHQHHIAELQPRHCQLFAGVHIFSRKIPILGDNFGISVVTQGFFNPGEILLPCDHFRIPLLHKTFKGTLRVASENTPLPLQHFAERIGGCRQRAGVIAFITQQQQQAVQGWHHLHAGGCQGVLPRPLVIEDHHPLLAFRLSFQSDITVDRLHKIGEPVRLGIYFGQPLVINPVGEQGVWPDGTVDFRRDNALGEKATAHAHPVCLPFFSKLRYIYCGEQRNVVPFQITHHIVPHAPVRHVYNCGDPHRIGMTVTDKGPHVPHRIHPVPAFLQLSHQGVRLTHLPGHNHTW